MPGKNYSMTSIESLIINTYKAAVNLRRASAEQIKKTLFEIADAIEKNISPLLEANAKDLAKQKTEQSSKRQADAE